MRIEVIQPEGQFNNSLKPLDSKYGDQLFFILFENRREEMKLGLGRGTLERLRRELPGRRGNWPQRVELAAVWSRFVCMGRRLGLGCRCLSAVASFGSGPCLG